MQVKIKKSKQQRKAWIGVENRLRLPDQKYVLLPRTVNQHIDSVSDFTISCVASFNTIVAGGPRSQSMSPILAGMHNPAGDTVYQNGIRFGIQDGGLEFALFSKSQTVIEERFYYRGEVFVAGVQYFCSAAYSYSTGTLTLRVNNHSKDIVLNKAHALSLKFPERDNYDLNIGLYNYYAGEAYPFGKCDLSNLCIFNKALSMPEQDLLQDEIGLIPKKLHSFVVGHWTCNQRSGKVLWDSVEQYNYAIPDSISNMEFENDTSGWTSVDSNSVLSWEDGTAKLVNQGVQAGGGIVTPFTMTANVKYQAEVKFTKTYGENSGDGYIDFEGVAGYQIGFAAGAGTYTATSYQISSSFNRVVSLKLHLGLGLGAVGTVEYFRIYKVDPDGSRVLAYPKKANHGELINFTDAETGVPRFFNTFPVYSHKYGQGYEAQYGTHGWSNADSDSENVFLALWPEGSFSEKLISANSTGIVVYNASIQVRSVTTRLDAINPVTNQVIATKNVRGGVQAYNTLTKENLLEFRMPEGKQVIIRSTVVERFADNWEIRVYEDRIIPEFGPSLTPITAWVNHYTKSFEEVIDAKGIEVKSNLSEITKALRIGTNAMAIDIDSSDTAMKGFLDSQEFSIVSRFYLAPSFNIIYAWNFKFTEGVNVESRITNNGGSPQIGFNRVGQGAQSTGGLQYGVINTVTISRIKGSGKVTVRVNNNPPNIIETEQLENLPAVATYATIMQAYGGDSGNSYNLGTYFISRFIDQAEHLNIHNNALLANPITKRGLVGYVDIHAPILTGTTPSGFTKYLPDPMLPSRRYGLAYADTQLNPTHPDYAVKRLDVLQGFPKEAKAYLDVARAGRGGNLRATFGSKQAVIDAFILLLKDTNLLPYLQTWVSPTFGAVHAGHDTILHFLYGLTGVQAANHEAAISVNTMGAGQEAMYRFVDGRHTVYSRTNAYDGMYGGHLTGIIGNKDKTLITVGTLKHKTNNPAQTLLLTGTRHADSNAATNNNAYIMYDGPNVVMGQNGATIVAPAVLEARQFYRLNYDSATSQYSAYRDNNVLLGQVTATSSITAGQFYFGGTDWWDDVWDGYLEHGIVFSKALTETEAKAVEDFINKL